MNNDLKIIKKKYGEAMMQFCRESFSTILDNSPGVLPTLLLEKFEPSHLLYDDLIECFCELEFKNYIYYLYNKLQEQDEPKKQAVADPVMLMKQAGYTLYECKTEADIQKFKKYYFPGEELCTFRGGRLNRCHVYFAVHENADKLKRRDFLKPHRQDEYGTSVISIQFTCDDTHTLSIKNRYNHTVSNPDATFGNNLDNIIPGLTQSFADHYGMIQRFSADDGNFELDDYIMASNGLLYRSNYEVHNIHYCPNNIVLNHFDIIRYPKERYVVMDYFILDLVNKKFVKQKKGYYHDPFPETIGEIEQITIKNESERKIITIIPKTGEPIEITLNKFNCIVSLKNNNVKIIPDNFLIRNYTLESFTLNNVTEIGDNFLSDNEKVQEISLPKVKNIGDNFMERNRATKISLPEVISIGSSFLTHNYGMKTLDFPNLKNIGNNFMHHNRNLEVISLPKVKNIGSHFLELNTGMKTLSLPSVETIGDFFCYTCQNIWKIDLPRVVTIGCTFMNCNRRLLEINLPEATSIGDYFLERNTELEIVNLPKITEIGAGSLIHATKITCFNVPNLDDKSFVNRNIRRYLQLTNKKLKV